MGSTSSKGAHRGRHRSPPPYTRSKSMPAHRPGRDAEVMMKTANDTTRVRDKGKRIVTAEEPPVIINTWEMMEGLEEGASGVSDTSWTQNSIVSDFDPEIISAFRKAMDELSPQHPLLLDRVDDVSSSRSIIKCPPNGERKVVLYVTSMRGVRKTYDDCSDARRILQGYGVRVDERDVLLHRGFKDELSDVLGFDSFDPSRLPSVFANCEHLGGADEVRRMHEEGALAKALEGCDAVAVGVCEACGDMRFVPCEACSGSHKVFVGEEEEGDAGGGFRPCSGCNENGLVRCAVCY